MKIKLHEIGVMEFQRETGACNSYSSYMRLDESITDKDLQLSKFFLSVKESALVYFSNIWETRNGIMHQVIDTEYIYEDVLVLNEETGEEEMQKIVVDTIEVDNTPINLDTDDYIIHYKNKYGVEPPSDYVPAIHPREELFTFEGFNFIEPVKSYIKINEPFNVQKNDTCIIMADVYDQYDQLVHGLEPIKLDTSNVGLVSVTFTHEDLTVTIDINVAEKILSDLEQMKILIANQIGGAYQ